MTRRTPTSKQFADRVIDALGGADAAREALERDHQVISQQWDQDLVSISRILRGHLFVEFYLGKYLMHRNPNLGDIEKAQLSFAKKLPSAIPAALHWITFFQVSAC